MARCFKRNNKNRYFKLERGVPMIISDMPPLQKTVLFLRHGSLVKSLKRLKPFRWRRPLEAGEAPFLKGSRLGGGPLIGRD